MGIEEIVFCTCQGERDIFHVYMCVCVGAPGMGWIFESQTASELTTVGIVVCSLDGIPETIK